MPVHRPKWTDVEEDRKLDALLDEISKACTISESARRIMDLTRAGENKLSAAADAVRKDPPIASELLRLANSPFFGQAKQVYDLKRAVVVVGMQELHNIAAAMSMMAAFASPNPIFEKLRESSVLCSEIARFTARHIQSEIEGHAFLAGLLNDIGAIACASVDTAQYTKLWDDAKGDRQTLARYERERYTVTCDEIGFHVLKRNRLPDETADAVRGDMTQSGLLGRIAAFARLASPVIAAAAEKKDMQMLSEQIPVLVDRVDLPRLDSEQWVRICVQAASAVRLDLGGEMLLTEEEEPKEEASSSNSKTADPAASEISEIVYAETETRRTLTQASLLPGPASSIRLTGEGRPAALFVVLGIVAAVLLVGGWLLFAI